MKGAGRTIGEHSQQGPIALSKQEALRRVAAAMDQVVNGEITVKMQGGKPIWVDSMSRERVG